MVGQMLEVGEDVGGAVCVRGGYVEGLNERMLGPGGDGREVVVAGGGRRCKCRCCECLGT